MSTTTTIPVGRVEDLRRCAGRAAAVRKDRMADGWAKSPIDPMRILACFGSLRIRDGYVLRAYQYCWRGNGNGLVWAMPADAEFPEPRECLRRRGAAFADPRPPGALDDPMQVIEGDGSPWSYLCASVLARELAELGALRHGCDWSTHEVLGADPTTGERAADWLWPRPRPIEWRPLVTQSATRTTVAFHTYSALGNEAVYRHVDSYRGRHYVHATRITRIATNGNGFVY